MKRRSISLIIGLMSFALLGVMAMQYYFLRESYTLKSQLFDQAVNDALKNVSYKLEKNEAAVFLANRAETERKANGRKRIREQFATDHKKGHKPKENSSIKFIKQLKANQAKSDSIFKLRDSILRSRYPNILVYNGPIDPGYSTQVISDVRYDYEEFIDEFGIRQNIVRQTFTERAIPSTKRLVDRGGVIIDSIKQYVVVDPILGPIVKTIGKPNYLSNISPKELADADKVLSKERQARNIKFFLDSVEKFNNKKEILDNIASEFQQADIPLLNRIQPHILDSLLLMELANNGILLDFSYKVSSSRNDSLIFRNASNVAFDLNAENTYKASLFPRDMVRDGGVITLTFPQKNSLILEKMDTILASSVGLLLILLVSFAYTIFSIIKQKKISEMKNDFINNMTHEFKTPVATIMIASEALKDPEVNEDIKRVNKLAGIIYDENVRLGDHIERVLNIAKIERDDIKIDHQEVDINDLILAVKDSMSLQLNKRNATVNMILEANNPLIMGDELHLSNVIYNLIDNANKYSKDNPEITISTYNKGSDLIITVADKGIGMSRDQQKKIFEQFYRIPTGNLHDVKGFGLGLSYVNNMVKKMGGIINVKSEKDKGSEFELRFHTA
jgi:two-component system phosphate regulon sensor histidine kinase PhoR